MVSNRFTCGSILSTTLRVIRGLFFDPTAAKKRKWNWKWNWKWNTGQSKYACDSINNTHLTNTFETYWRVHILLYKKDVSLSYLLPLYEFAYFLVKLPVVPNILVLFQLWLLGVLHPPDLIVLYKVLTKQKLRY